MSEPSRKGEILQIFTELFPPPPPRFPHRTSETDLQLRGPNTLPWRSRMRWAAVSLQNFFTTFKGRMVRARLPPTTHFIAKGYSGGFFLGAGGVERQILANPRPSGEENPVPRSPMPLPTEQRDAGKRRERSITVTYLLDLAFSSAPLPRWPVRPAPRGPVAVAVGAGAATAAEARGFWASPGWATYASSPSSPVRPPYPRLGAGRCHRSAQSSHNALPRHGVR
jgi:hypothetical protein